MIFVSQTIYLMVMLCLLAVSTGFAVEAGSFIVWSWIGLMFPLNILGCLAMASANQRMLADRLLGEHSVTVYTWHSRAVHVYMAFILFWLSVFAHDPVLGWSPWFMALHTFNWLTYALMNERVANALKHG